MASCKVHGALLGWHCTQKCSPPQSQFIKTAPTIRPIDREILAGSFARQVWQGKLWRKAACFQLQHLLNNRTSYSWTIWVDKSSGLQSLILEQWLRDCQISQQWICSTRDIKVRGYTQLGTLRYVPRKAQLNDRKGKKGHQELHENCEL